MDALHNLRMSRMDELVGTIEPENMYFQYLYVRFKCDQQELLKEVEQSWITLRDNDNLSLDQQTLIFFEVSAINFFITLQKLFFETE